jgi:anti-sigma factor RsiW
MSPCPSFEELSAFVDGDLVHGRELAVRRHLDVCEACRASSCAVSALKQAVGRAYSPQSAPPELQRAVMARAATPKRNPRWWLAPIAALLLLAAGAALWSWERTAQLGTFAAALIAEHVNHLSEADVVEAATEDAEGLSRWFSACLAYPVLVNKLPDSRLLGGRQRTVLGQRLALAFFDKHGERISLFIGNATAPSSDDRIRRSFGAIHQRRCTDSGDYRVCLHRDGERIVGVVAHRRVQPELLLTAP